VSLRIVFIVLAASVCELQADWRPPADPSVRVTQDGAGVWKVTSSLSGDYTIESHQQYNAAAGDAFEISVRVRVDFHTQALPELVCYDRQGREIPAPSLLHTMPTQVTTDWQSLRRVYPAQAGTASVRARIRGTGRGEFWISDLQFGPRKIDPYETGALISQIYANRRRGLVLSVNLGIVNQDAVSKMDRDKDGKWALVTVDLDQISQPEKKGEDWRTGFMYRPNEIYWFDGAVLKSDSVVDDRTPDFKRALQYRGRVHPGAYQVIMNDPGRAVAVSLDGKTWKRFEGGAEAELGRIEAAGGTIELWVDACYRDRTSAGPAYFNYIRLFPVDHAPSVDKLFAAARQAPPKLTRGSVDQKDIPIAVQGVRFAGGGNWPVRSGAPIPRGELASAGNVQVLNEAGEAIGAQSRAMATWPDGSVKWLFVDFAHDFSRNAAGRYRIRYGNRVQPAAAKERVEISASDAGLEVNTGAIRFLVPKARFGMVENVRLASGKVLQAGPIAVEISEPGGKIWRAADLPAARLEIEQAGPRHAVIRVETALPASGKPASGFYHRARIHAYAGSPLIGVDYFVANTDSRPAENVGGSMSSKLYVDSIALKLQPAGAVFAVRHGLGAGASAGAVVQQTADVAFVNSSEVRQHVPGWMSVALQGGGAIQVGVPAFREQYPKAFRWSPNHIEIALWAKEGGQYEWYEGVGKTHHLSLLYAANSVENGQLLAEGPVLALATPEWYTASGAFGPLVTASASGLPAIEESLRRNMKGPFVDEVGLGFENYGDHASPGYVKGSRLWDNNEYDTPAGGMVHFARTGDRDALRIALAGALHYLDVDTIHYSSRHANWAGAAHTHSHVIFGHHTAEGPNMHHAGYVQGLIWYSYLTGEPIGILGAQGIADWVLGSIKPDASVGSMERALGHSLMTLTDAYEATWNDKYLRGAARMVDWALKWEHPVLSGFLAPITEAPGFYAGSPGVGAGTIHAGLIKFNSWANLPEIDRMLERVARWTLVFPWRPPAGVISKAPVKGAPASAMTMSENVRLMHYAFAKTGDPAFLAVPRKSIVEAFVSTDPRVSTRSTGRVYNYVPWFLTSLHETGNPEPEADLEVEADVAELQVVRGQKAYVTFRVRNRAASPVESARFSLQPRLDLRASLISPAFHAVAPREVRELRYEIQAPERINLTSESNRISYAHFSGLYRRGAKNHVAHLAVQITVTE
jgi:hypothetical protein